MTNQTMYRVSVGLVAIVAAVVLLFSGAASAQTVNTYNSTLPDMTANPMRSNTIIPGAVNIPSGNTNTVGTTVVSNGSTNTPGIPNTGSMDSGMTAPGVPNTGAGGESLAYEIVLLLSGLLALAAGGALVMRLRK